MWSSTKKFTNAGDKIPRWWEEYAGDVVDAPDDIDLTELRGQRVGNGEVDNSLISETEVGQARKRENKSR